MQKVQDAPFLGEDGLREQASVEIRKLNYSIWGAVLAQY